MSFALKSCTLQSSGTEQQIKFNGPVKVLLNGPHSYRYLNSISNPDLIKVLEKVGMAYEKTQTNNFKFEHTFTPAENGDLANGVVAKEIFSFVKEAFKEKIDLDLKDMTNLRITKLADGSFINPQKAYELSLIFSGWKIDPNIEPNNLKTVYYMPV